MIDPVADIGMADGDIARRSRNSCPMATPGPITAPGPSRVPSPISAPRADHHAGRQLHILAQARLGRYRLALRPARLGMRRIEQRGDGGESLARPRRLPAGSCRPARAGACRPLAKRNRHQTDAGARRRQRPRARCAAPEKNVRCCGPGAGQVGQIVQISTPRIGAGRHGDARFFANLRQSERPTIFEKAGIGHARSARYFLGCAAPAAAR